MKDKTSKISFEFLGRTKGILHCKANLPGSAYDFYLSLTQKDTTLVLDVSVKSKGIGTMAIRTKSKDFEINIPLECQSIQLIYKNEDVRTYSIEECEISEDLHPN